ncbi:acyltransferase-like protein At1g54570, chloroplastic [Papaver somniferum]|uniref:acyltransferase-like protein At1g54570, chloroplastic n=1 Tax=Papaver somniferum TaxID=3469 RepID=UPI000E6F9DBC|nr:acyltransferase-like protein At1g54570, chloroplastic [Papaver somniferum]
MAAANLYSTVNLKLSNSFHKNSTNFRHKPISSLFAEPTRTAFEKSETGRRRRILKASILDEFEIERLSVKDYLERSIDLIKPDGGPPRWFSPVESNSSGGGVRFEDSPLLLYLPGLDGVGLGLIMHHQRLGKMFDVWCLHIPVMDRTPFEDHVQLVERTIKSENASAPYRPIYLVGESLGGCLALAVAARNPDIDLMVILANPATSFNKSPMQPILPLLEVIPEQLHAGLPYFLGFVTGDPFKMAMAVVEKGLPLQQAVGELSESVVAMLPSLSVLADILPRESLLWKLQMLRSASSFANSRLHAVKAEVLVLASGKDQLIPSQEEAERLFHMLPACQIRNFAESGHTLFMEDGFDLVTVIKGAGFYRRTKKLDYVSDFMHPNQSEVTKMYDSYRWVDVAANPVMLSTLENGEVVKGLGGIPSDGPVVYVGYHMLLGLELGPLVSRFLAEKNILLRGIAHPMMFAKIWERSLPDSSSFDVYRIMGGVPVSANNFYRLLSKKSHVLLYPGGVREALHRKGEAYKLFWPSQSEFVRMAANFGAKIVPFGVVGEDDLFDVVFDYDDYMKFPWSKAWVEDLNNGRVRKLRNEAKGEVTEEDLHFPGILPKIPGRFYFLFGKLIETEGRNEELRDKEKAHELYLHVKSEVERQIEYLKDKRENDPYRTLLSRLIYQASHGFTSEIPTFEV